MKRNPKKRKKSYIKLWASRLHLWFGLGVGLLIFIIAITGCLYVFKDEIQNQLRKDAIYHHEQNTATQKVLPIRTLESKVQAQTKEPYPIQWVDIPLDKSRSYIFNYYQTNPDAWNYFDEVVVYKTAYVNPFTGKVLAVYDEKNGFFNIVKFIHWSFLLKSEWGKYLTGIPVIIFVVMLISGIILWWPKNKNAGRQRIWFRWKNIKTWKRKNYDLHSILGFYVSFIALIIAITGLFYAFTSVQQAIYVAFSGKTTMPDFSNYVTEAPDSLRNEATLDKISAAADKRYPQAFSYTLSLQTIPSKDVTSAYTVYVRQLSYSYHKMHTLFFDANSGALLYVYDYKHKNGGEKMVAANYDIHVGSVYGIPTKILAFIASLICASLPITGFLVWYGRKKKSKKSRPKRS